MKKLIKNGTIVLEDKVIQGDLLIEDEVIAAIGQDLEADGEQVRNNCCSIWRYDNNCGSYGIWSERM